MFGSGLLEHQRFMDVMNELFAPWERFAFMTAEGQLLYLSYETLSDIGTLPQCCEIGHKYLQIMDNDIFLTNDPYSGGTALSSPTLVMGFGTKPGKAEFLFASRLTLIPRSGPHKSIDDEGLRIPPSPFLIQGKLNEPLIEALTNHPNAAPGMIDALKDRAKALLKLREKLLIIIAANGMDLSKAFIKSYLKSSEEHFKKILEELPEGEATHEEGLGQNESLRLRIEVHEGTVQFDFSGTSQGTRTFLTDGSTYGACVGAFLSLFDMRIPLDSGVLSALHITAPRGSLVNASFPRPLLLGHTDGLLAIANIVLDTYGKLHKSKQMGRGACTHLMFELDFGNGKIYLDSLGHGVGARPNKAGQSATHFWRRISRYYSVEMVENNYPLEIINTGARTNSGGDGLHPGGDGMVRTFKVLQKCKMKWQYIDPERKPEGVQGGKSALPAEFFLTRGQSEKVKLATEGVMEILENDLLTVMTPGGGGFGQPQATST